MSRQERIARWMLALPLLLFIIILVVFPIIYGISMSFQDARAGSISTSFVGFDNYLAIFKDKSFWNSISFTLKFTIIVTVFELILGGFLAILFNRAFPGKRLLLSIILLPIMIAPSLMGIMFRLILNENIGIITYFLSKLGLQVNLFDPNSIVKILIILDIVQWIPFTFLIIYSGLQSMDESVVEASKVDGANSWQRLTRITIPLLKPIIIITLFLRGIDAFRTFDVIFVLTNGGPGTLTTTLSIFLYKTGFTQGNISVAATASIIIGLMLMIIMPFFIKQFRKTY